MRCSLEFNADPEIPDLKMCIAHAGTKRRLKAKTTNRDSGISGTGWPCGEHKLRDFRTPYLRRPVEYMLVHRSGQMWRFSLNHFRDSASDLKTIATFDQNGVLAYTQLVSLSRGF